MKAERPPQCILGNGECPQECRLFENSKEITNVLGDAFDPQESRRRIVFADAFSHDINVTHVAAVMARCAKEGKIQTSEQIQPAPRPIPQRPPQK